MSLKQKDAVYVTVKAVVEASWGPWTDGLPAKEILKKLGLRSRVTEDLILGFKEGQIAHKKAGLTEAQLHAYASSLLTNWLAKDERLGAVPKVEPGEPDQMIEPDHPEVSPEVVQSIALSVVADMDSRPTFDSRDGRWFVTHGDKVIDMPSRQACREYVRKHRRG